MQVETESVAETPQSAAVDPPIQPPPDPRSDKLAIALLILLPTLFFGDVLLGFGNFYMRDLTRYYYPTKQIYREIAYGGELPLWNRHFSAGQPIAANPEHEIFYPLTWLVLLPNYDLGYRLHILIHIYIGLLGMYALLRSMELRAPASFFGAVAFGLGGIYLSYINLLPILFCAAWLPLTCLLVRRFLRGPRVWLFAASALSLGMQFLVAEPTTVLQTGFLTGMYALYHGWYSERRMSSMAKNVLWIALISIAAFSVGAVQMLPAIDHVGDSARSRAFDFALVKTWSLPWAKLAELIYPNILGHIAIKRVMWYWAGGLYPGMGSPFLFSIYSGLAVTALAVAGMFARPRGARFVLILVLFSLAISLGGNTPILEWLHHAGIATSVRYPEKFILIAVFALIIFASSVLDRILAGDRDLRDAAAGFALATTVVALVIAIVAFTPLYPRVFMKIWGMTAGGGTTRMIAISRIDWAAAAVRGCALVALLLTVTTSRRRIWFSSALLFLCLDLGFAMHELNPRMPSRFFTASPPVAQTLAKNRDSYRIFHEADWYGNEDPARRFLSTGDAVYWIVRNGLLPMTPAGHDFSMVIERDYDKTALLPTIDLTESVWDVKRWGRSDWWKPFMAMSNARYRAVYASFDEEKKRTHGDFKNALPIRFIDVEQHPRYYFADQIVQIRNRADFVKKLSTESFSNRVAFISARSFVPASGTVTRFRETANTATIDIESRGDGFLVMSVTPHKYWRITIDGRPVEPLITNIGYQGVRVPKGRHRVDMRYWNDLVGKGGIISIFSVSILVLMAGMGRKRRQT
ncbi:MAG: YfhO family protein [Thermoanaerobaculia bacterium]|nr:YfhO family protein [Thermoanaerobaculia bacterium]